MWTTAHSFLGFPLVTAYQTYGFPFLEFKGIVVDCMGQCPLLLGGGEWAKLPTHCQYLLLLLVSRSHSRML